VQHLPPLSLYIHIPWCVQKCPYCDFNSHAQKGQQIPEQEYIQHLLGDLRNDAPLACGRPIHSIFIGGGTPSLLSGQAMQQLLDGVRALIPLQENAEVTLEANPGTVEAGRFSEYVQAGVNRISIGVQSMQQDKLKALGRIHSQEEAINAAKQAHDVGLRSFNLDLMHGLPGQSIDDALADLTQIIALQPPHISWYQLTIEPNTQFYSKPPTLPEDDTLWQIQERGQALLAEAGYQQYEISGYAKPGHQCQHNLNYWRFGDYLGIGCGAHGKITKPDGQIVRTEKVKHPRGYMDLTKPYLYRDWSVSEQERPFEFMMNRLRLMESCPIAEFAQLTGLALSHIEPQLQRAQQLGLIALDNTQLTVTAQGHRYLNELLALFVDD
tara:strand:- start:3505 stop:4650 length:1146 start_codon:yes stop_codon:yes gene_type:complete